MIADLCLVLLLDASGSIDQSAWDLQAKATAAAIADRSVVERITRGPHGRIMVMALEWSSSFTQMLPWTPIASAADAESAAGALIAHRRVQNGATAVGEALEAAVQSIRSGPDCVRHVIDISSDGVNNNGVEPRKPMATLKGMDVTVNALVIEGEYGVFDYYKDTVSGFVMSATWDGFGQAIKAKLQLEVAGLQ